MFFGPIGNDALTFLRHTVLLVSIDTPPIVLSALVNSRRAFFETLSFQRRLHALSFPMRIEINPKGRRRGTIRGNAEADHLARLFAHARSGMANMRRENIMRDSRLRNTFNPRNFSHSELGGLPLDLWPLHRHIGIPCGMERDCVCAIC